MGDCLTEADLHQYRAGELDVTGEGRVRRHLAECEKCARRDAELVAEQEVIQGRVRGLDLGETESLAPTEPSAPEHIGPFRILETLGEGGMGIVYLAEQTKPIRRRVALKVIKRGLDTREVIARFEAEQQALAMMDHPNVARVFEAGATEGGQPYFVMEHVKGLAITDYCDKHRLTNRERLGLFIEVCNAIQHAHQKGIIHRDIKPSNVLVTTGPVAADLRVGRPVPKVIDFGVAKATEHRLTEKTIFTEQGRLIGTPSYMSPEQAEMSGLDIDTRSDIYSLGVLLYELLVGALPFDPAELRRAGFAEIQRIIREQEPPKPSTRLSSLGDASTTCAQQRRTDPGSLARQLRGDLDWITMKALDKDRTRRYATASDFAADIQRHLTHEPVVAGPPSAGYRLAKFVRRNRAGVAAAGVIAAVLVVATAVSIGFALSEAEQRRIAQAAEREQSRAREEAERQTTIAKAVNDFLTEDLLAAVAPSPESGQGKDVLMRDVLDEAAERIEQASRVGGRFEEMPLVEASIRATLGSTYRLLGEYAAAEPHLERARLLRRRELGKEHPSTLRSMGGLANLYSDQGRYDEAEPLFVKTLEIQKRVLREEHPDTLASMNNLANLYLTQGRNDEAEPVYVKTLEIQKRVLGDEHPNTLASMNNLAILYMQQGRYDEAESLYVKTLEIRKRVLGEEHPSTLGSMGNLAGLYEGQGRYGKAEPLYVKTLEIQKRVLGEEHPDALGCMNNLAILYMQQGRYDEAEPLYVKTLEIQKRVLGEEHRSTLGSITNLGLLYLSMKRFDDARAMFERSLPIKRRVLGMGHPWTRTALRGLATAYDGMDRGYDALPFWRELLEFQLAQVEDPDASAQVLNAAAWGLLTKEHAELCDPARALPLAQRAVDQAGGGDPGTLDTLALAQFMTGDIAAAIETEEKALSLLPPDAPGRGDYEAALTRFEAALKEADAAEETGGG